jgi:lycopene cyclase domain-containing protein
MTYFEFLAIFVGIPIAILSVITILDYRRGKWLPSVFGAWKPLTVLTGLMIVAFAYTTPWDNYLVATGVWYYNRDLVTGIIFWYVPLEEYVFFLLLPVMAGLFTLLLMRYLPINPTSLNPVSGLRFRVVLTGILFVLWILSVGIFIASATTTEWDMFKYLSITLSWALIPIMLQTAFGADILLRHWRVVLPSVIVIGGYLSWADSLAILATTWSIAPQYSLPIMIGGVLPFEEAFFFFTVTTLCVMGLTLVLAQESQERALQWAIWAERFAILRPFAQRLKVTFAPHS